MLVGVTIVCHLTVCIPAYFSSYTFVLFWFLPCGNTHSGVHDGLSIRNFICKIYMDIVCIYIYKMIILYDNTVKHDKYVCISFHSKSKDSKVELRGDRICRVSTGLNRLPDGAYLCQLTHTPWSCGPQICRRPSGSLWSEAVKGCQIVKH